MYDTLFQGTAKCTDSKFLFNVCAYIGVYLKSVLKNNIFHHFDSLNSEHGLNK